MAGPSLSQLFRRYADEGDVRALGEVFDRAAPELLAVARHLAVDEAAAEDVVQATFLAAIEHPERFDPSRDLVPWLLGILANKARVARTSGARVPDPARLPGERVEDPETDAQLREFMATLEKALERVPEAYRKVLRIHLAEGKTPEEIARELERSSGTVRVQLHRGLRHLRRKLPAGFALGSLVVITAPKGLAAMRTQVLERGSSLAGSGAAGGVTAGIVGGVLVGKKLAVAAVMIVLASISWWMMREPSMSFEEAQAARVAPTNLESTKAEQTVPTPLLGGSETSSESSARESAARPTDPFGSLDLEWTWDDGTPAAALGVGAVCVDESGQFGYQVYASTDQNGHVTFERLPPGDLLIQIDRGCSSEFLRNSVKAGERTFARYSVRPGRDLRGRVLDPEGRPVGGAIVWLASNSSSPGTPVARSGSDGSYEVRDIDPSCGVFATREGFGPSALEPIRERPPEEAGKLALDLTMRGEGGNVSGVVRDAEGKPLENAWLVAHCAASRQGGERFQWPSPWTATDSAGAFRFEGLRPGAVQIKAEFEGFATWLGITTVVAGSTVSMSVRMDEGFAVEGTVRTAEGTPAGGARIIQGPRPDSPDYVYHRYLSVRADDEGRFKFSPIASGPVDLKAEWRTKEDFGRATTSVTGSVGETLAWNPVLERFPEIRGRLVDESGRPVQGWMIEVRANVILDSPPRGAETDADGRFVLFDCADVPFRVEALPPRQPGQTRRAAAGAIAEGVRPGKEELVLTVTRTSKPTAFFIGKAVDELGVPIGGATIQVNRGSNYATGATTKPEDGAFRIGPLPAGEWDLTLFRDDIPPFRLGRHQLSPDEEWDLGTITLKERGRFELVLLREDGAQVAQPIVTLRDGEHSHSLETTDGSTFRSEDLYVGTYVLFPVGANVATLTPRVEIRGGATTKLELRLPAGVMQLVSFHAPGGEQGPNRLRGVVRSTDGKTAVEVMAWASPTRDGKRHTGFFVGVVPGQYVLTASSEDGWSSELAFEVADTGSPPAPVEALLVRAR